MKRVWTILLALCLLGLTACGGSGELYVVEGTDADGTKMIEHYDGKKGPILWCRYEYPDGSCSETTFGEGQVIVSDIYYGADGAVYESEYYPSGNVSKSISHEADGTCQEIYYLDNGEIDEATGYPLTSGSVEYSKFTDGNGYCREEWFGDDNVIERSVENDSTRGVHRETEYYENGSEKKSIETNEEQDLYRELEYYENGQVMHFLHVDGDKRTLEERYDEEGYRTYYMDKNENLTLECIADESGKLVKVIEDGKEYTSGSKLKQMVKALNFRS